MKRLALSFTLLLGFAVFTQSAYAVEFSTIQTNGPINSGQALVSQQELVNDFYESFNARSNQETTQKPDVIPSITAYVPEQEREVNTAFAMGTGSSSPELVNDPNSLNDTTDTLVTSNLQASVFASRQNNTGFNQGIFLIPLLIILAIIIIVRMRKRRYVKYRQPRGFYYRDPQRYYRQPQMRVSG
jgi:ATP-dependent Zn protease